MRIVYSYDNSVEEHVFETESSHILIGRQKGKLKPDFDVTEIDTHQTVSRPHARLWMEAGQYWIENLSTSGYKQATLVDDQPIENAVCVRVSLGALVQLGKLKLWIKEKEMEIAPGLALEPAGVPTPAPVSPALPRLQVNLLGLSAINYSIFFSGTPLCTSIEIRNNSTVEVTDLTLDLTLENYARLRTPIHIPSIPANGSIRIEGREGLDKKNLDFDLERLTLLQDETILSISVTLNGEPVPVSPATITLLPPNAWTMEPERIALAGFVNPLSAAVEEIRNRAKFALKRLTGEENFDVVVDTDKPLQREKAVKALYQCLEERYDIVYGYEPLNFDECWQPVRLHHQVIEGEGTCIDLALLMAACMEIIGIPPILLLIDTGGVAHALIAGWCGEPEEMLHYPPVVTNLQDVLSLLDSPNFLVLDSVGFAKGKKAEQTFTTCKTRGRNYLKKAVENREEHRFLFAVNVREARQQKILPMPFGTGVQYQQNAAQAIFEAKAEAARLCSPLLTARHLFLGLLTIDDGWLSRVLLHLGKDPMLMTEMIRGSFPEEKKAPRVLLEDKHWKAIILALTERPGALPITEIDLLTMLFKTASMLDKILSISGTTCQECLETLQDLTGGDPLDSGWRSSGDQS